MTVRARKSYLATPDRQKSADEPLIVDDYAREADGEDRA